MQKLTRTVQLIWKKKKVLNSATVQIEAIRSQTHLQQNRAVTVDSGPRSIQIPSGI